MGRGEFLPLGQQEREQAQPLLAARAVGAQLAAGAPEREVVAVWAVPREPALEVGVHALGELGGQHLRALGARPRPVPQLDLAFEAEALGVLCITWSQPLDSGGTV